MLSPNIIGFLLFFAGPLLLSFYLSFTDSSVGQVPGFIGIANYADILSLQFIPIGDAATGQAALGFEFDVLAQFNWFGTEYVVGAKDTLFWRSMGNTLLFCLILVPLSTIPAIILAMLLNADLPGMKFFRAVYFLPSVAAVVGTALVWRWLYDPTIGF
ncbi:MAG: sugar ABC transporter permease, partial [Myxococcales bacterium]|nr:sugar ABC transporter permease [Myxococcales bacterium]